MLLKLKPRISQNTVAGVLLALTSCSSGPAQRVFSERDVNRNNYYSFFLSQPDDFRQLLAQSPFHLLRASNDVFLESVSSERRYQGIFSGIAPTFIHGDFHVQQATSIEGSPQIDDFDTGDWGPFWIDLVRLESSALVAAHVQGLRLYTAGTCTNSYFAQLKNVQTPQPQIVALRGSPEFSKDSSESSKADNAIPKEWQRAQKNENAQDLKDAFIAWFAQQRPKSEVLELRALQSGVGSFKTEKYLVQTKDENKKISFWELKKQDPHPLSKLRRSARSGQMTACDRYTRAKKVFQKSGQPECWQYQDKSFSLKLWIPDYPSPDLDLFNDEKKLYSHVSWMCAELLAAHIKNWDPLVIDELRFGVHRNPLIAERILLMAQDETLKLLEAHRMILEKQNQGSSEAAQ